MSNNQLGNQNALTIPEPSQDHTQEFNPDIPNAKSKFKQQRLPACRPFLTPLSASIVYLVFFVVSLVFGLVYLKSSHDIFELEITYSDKCDKITNGTGNICTFDIQIDDDVKGPIYIYYQLTNFYQNNFLYGDSKNWDQLRGKKYKKQKDLDSCDPVARAPEYKRDKNFSKYIYVPCGAVPLSVFNDTFEVEGENLPTFSSDDITLKNFRKLFKDPNSVYSEGEHWMDATIFPGEQTNQHFINWVQLAPFSKFRKLYAKTDKKSVLKKGNYTIKIHNNYPVHQFKGKKSIIMAKVEWIGGKNRFFGIFFLVMCGLSGFAAILFCIFYLTNALPLYKSLKAAGNSIDLSLIT